MSLRPYRYNRKLPSPLCSSVPTDVNAAFQQQHRYNYETKKKHTQKRKLNLGRNMDEGIHMYFSWARKKNKTATKSSCTQAKYDEAIWILNFLLFITLFNGFLFKGSCSSKSILFIYSFFFTEENTVQPYFFFFSFPKHHLEELRLHASVVRSLTSSLELRGWRSVCWLLRSYIVSTGSLGQICNLVLQGEGLVINFSWFYCKSRVSVSYHSPSSHTSCLFFNCSIREAKLKTSL